MKNTDILEYQNTLIFKVPCLLLSTMLIAFNTSHTLHTKGTFRIRKRQTLTFIQKFLFSQSTNLDQSIMQMVVKICQLKKKPYPNQNCINIGYRVSGPHPMY